MWQHIQHGGRKPGFTWDKCSLCKQPLILGMEHYSHLLVACKSHQVNTCGSQCLGQHISYLDWTKASLWESTPNELLDSWGIEDEMLRSLPQWVLCGAGPLIIIRIGLSYCCLTGLASQSCGLGLLILLCSVMSCCLPWPSFDAWGCISTLPC